MAFLENTGLERLWGHIVHRLSLKADKEDLKALSKTVDELPQSDWNQNDETAKDYVKNRPFGEKTVMGDTITWDGNTEGKITVGDSYAKVSDVVLTLEDFADGGCIVWSDGEELFFSQGEISGGSHGYFLGAGCYFVFEDGCVDKEEGYHFPEKGIYVGYGSDFYTTSLTINGYNGFPRTEIDYLDPKYIKDMYYAGDPVETVIVEETTFELVDGMGLLTASLPLQAGQEYIINLDGVQYNSVCKEINLDGMALSYLGNLVAPFPDSGTDTGEPFFIAPMDSNIELGIMVNSDVTEHTVSVVGTISEVYKIDEKYIPDSLKKSIDEKAGLKVEGTVYTINDKEVTASVGAEVFNIYKKNADGDENIASGDYSHAEGLNTIANGHRSHAEGASTEASGWDSHAEGNNTIASGLESHAEGNTTTASGNYGSHAEGYKTTASGTGAHAEGYQTTASGDYSHAEGYETAAFRQASHAEGYGAIASGEGSHAEGYGTIASGEGSHAEGKYNIAEVAYTNMGYSGGSIRCLVPDGEYCYISETYEFDATTGVYTLLNPVWIQLTTGMSFDGKRFICGNGGKSDFVIYKLSATSVLYDRKYYHTASERREAAIKLKAKYAHIVGNGTDDDNRSNAHTLDWDGNAWFAGDVYVGSTSGTNKDEGSKKLVTEDDIDFDEIEILAEAGVADPVTDENGQVLTDANNIIYIF